MQVKPVKAVKPKLVLHYDSTKVQTRGFNNTALKNFGKQPEFQYKGSYTGPSLWHLLWTWVWDMIERFLLKGNSGSFFFGFLKYFFILLGASAVAFLILRLSGVDALNIFRGKPISAGLSHSESLENIHEIDFDADIEKAVAQRNYRFAVRLLYLKCLKHLSDTGQIHWEINKTNSTYISELANLEQRIAFNLLTRQFEYIWYGEFMIDAPVFTKVNALFNDFKAKAA
jgi:hypothetical protein